MTVTTPFMVTTVPVMAWAVIVAERNRWAIIHRGWTVIDGRGRCIINRWGCDIHWGRRMVIRGADIKAETY